MIVLEKNAVGKIIAVVIAAAYANGIFLENTVVRGGFSGVQKLDPGSLKKSCNLAGVGGDSAHSLEIVEGGSFSAKEHTDISVNFSHKLFIFYVVSVFYIEFSSGGWIQKCENTLKNLEPADDSIFFADKIYNAWSGIGHNAVGRYVFACDIFF